MCKTAGDAELLFQALAGETIRPAEPEIPKKIGILQTLAVDNLDPQVESAFASCITKLSNSGITFGDIYFDFMDELFELAMPTFNFEAYAEWKDKLETHGDLMFPPIYERFMSGKDITRAA